MRAKGTWEVQVQDTKWPGVAKGFCKCYVRPQESTRWVLERLSRFRSCWKTNTMRHPRHEASPGEIDSRDSSGSRHCLQSQVGHRRARVIKVIAKMPLNSGKDKMALVLLTLKHMENLETNEAIVNYEEGLGGGPLGRVS
jgi:hypothetical protein